MPQAAYNLKTFENRETGIRVARTSSQPKKKRLWRINWAPVKIAALSVVFLALIFSVLYSYSQITELTGDISQRQTELSDLKGEYDYLDALLQSKASLRTVEEYATTQLNLAKMDNGQIEYITLQSENKIETKQTTVDWWGSIKSGFLNIMEYLVP